MLCFNAPVNGRWRCNQGNLSFALTVKGASVGNATISNVVLVPGNNTLPLRANVVLASIVAGVDSTTGTAQLTTQLTTAVFNGQRLSYFVGCSLYLWYWIRVFADHGSNRRLLLQINHSCQRWRYPMSSWELQTRKTKGIGIEALVRLKLMMYLIMSMKGVWRLGTCGAARWYEPSQLACIISIVWI